MQQVAVGYQDSAVAGNGYSFTCPTTGRDARFLVCAFKRTKHWKGQRSADTDCHTAMCGGKCPVVHMLHLEWKQGRRMFYDAEPRTHILPKEIIDRVASIILSPYHTQGMTLTNEQRERLFGNEKMVIPAASTAPAKERQPRKQKTEEKIDLTSELGKVDVDMSSLINKSIGV
jgi:hypothetical protein